MLSVANEPIMLSVVMLSVIMLNVVAPVKCLLNSITIAIHIVFYILRLRKLD